MKQHLLENMKKPSQDKVVFYTLLQKKCTLISFSSPGDPGSLTLIPGHKPNSHESKLLSKRNATFEK